MRIGIDYTAAVRQGAGIGRYCRELIRALAQVDQDNEYLLLIAGNSSPEEKDKLDSAFAGARNFSYRHLRLSERWLYRLWHRLQLPLPIEIVSGRLDLFHSPDFTLPPTRARTILTVHDLSFLRVPQHADPRLRQYLHKVVPRSVRRADLVLADSESTKRDLIELLDTPVERVRVVMAGVDAHFQPVTDEAALTRIRERYRLPERFILSVGTLQPRKNFVGLIEAFHQMRQRTHAPQRLVIVGQKGWLYDEIFATVATLGLEEQVSFLGFVADEDLPALYTLADLFAFPSFYEGFGIPILEAMACGTPVVASDASSLPEVVGEAGLMVKPEDTAALAEAMERALDDAALRVELIARGREQARRFTWEQSARQLHAAYQAVMAKA